MEIIGLHYHILDKIECRIKIQSRIISIYPINANDESKINNPVNNEKWNFRKVNWKESKPVKPKNGNILNSEWVWKYSHVIEYMTDKNETQRIFINPNNLEINKIKWNNGDLFWQRITLYESIIAGLIVLFLQITGNAIYNNFIKLNTNTEHKKTIIQKTQNCQQINAPIIDTTTSENADLKRHQIDSLRQDMIIK